MAKRARATKLLSPVGRKKSGRKLTPVQVCEQVLATYELTKGADGVGNLSETARICHVSPRTVKKIVTGQHGKPSENQGSTLSEGEARSEPPKRCPDCGHLLEVLPCRLCKARADLEHLRKLHAQKLAAGPREANPLHHPRGRRAPRRDARGQRLLPLETDDGPYELLDLKGIRDRGEDQGARENPNQLDLKAVHSARFRAVVAARKKAIQQVHDGELGGLPF